MINFVKCKCYIEFNFFRSRKVNAIAIHIFSIEEFACIFISLWFQSLSSLKSDSEFIYNKVNMTKKKSLEFFTEFFFVAIYEWVEYQVCHVSIKSCLFNVSDNTTHRLNRIQCVSNFFDLFLQQNVSFKRR